MTLRILWGALTSTMAVYAVVLQVTAGQRSGPPPDPPVVMALTLAAIVAAAVSYVLPKRLYKVAADAAEVELTKEADPDGSVIFRESAPMVTVFADPAQARRKAAALFFTPFILGMALSEAVGIMGFLLGFLGAGLADFAPLMVLSAGLMLLRYPSEARVDGAFAEAKGAKFPD